MAEHDDTLTPTQTHALQLLLDGHNRSEVADAVGIGRTTLYRWLDEGHRFRHAYDAACDQAVREAMRVLRAGATIAAASLVRVAREGTSSDGPKVAAARAVLDRVGLPETTRHEVDQRGASLVAVVSSWSPEERRAMLGQIDAIEAEE